MANNRRNRKNNKAALAVSTKKESHFSEELIEDKMFLLASIVESSDDAIITKTSTGTITSWNSGAEKIYGFSANEVVGKPRVSFFPPAVSAGQKRMVL